MNSQNFIWGVANSAFQVEGSPKDSDWYQWTHKKSKIKDHSNADLACDFWNRYEEDFKLAKELGCQAFRLSLAWERIQPDENTFNLEALEHYKKILECMKVNGLKPFLTLNHFVLPCWLSKKGGYTHSKFPEFFEKFSLKVLEFFNKENPLVEHVMTFNEPMVLSYASYVQGIWPPGKKNQFEDAMRAAFNMALAHVQTYSKLKESYPNLQIGMAHHWRVFYPKRKYSPVDHLLSRVSDWSFNKQFVESITSGSIFFWTLGSKTMRKANVQKNCLDFLGINYYGRIFVGACLESPFVKIEEGPGDKTDLGWEIFPQGIRRACEDAHQLYKGPVYITENGLADGKDSKRPDFIESHLALIQKIKNELNIKGYFHWSLTDNFEWAEGLEPRFGLVNVDYSTGQRKPRPSFFAYKRLIQNEFR